MGKARRSRECPQCRRAMHRAITVCPFCGSVLKHQRVQAARPDVAAQAIRLRDAFPLLDYEGVPLPGHARPQEQPQEATPLSGASRWIDASLP